MLSNKELKNATLTATIFITDKCNLACKYCYEENKEFKTNSKENIDKFLNFIFTNEYYSKFGYIVLDFIGGEALLEWQLVEYSINKFLEIGNSLNHSWIKEKRFTLFTTTNGTLFDVPDIRAFLDRWPCFQCGLSLDGCKEAHDKNRIYIDGRGSYDTIMKNFEWWKNRYKQDLVKGTLSKETLPLLSEMLINQIKLGMQPWANPVYEEKWTLEDTNLYYKELKKVVDYIFENNLFLKVKMIGRFRPRSIDTNDKNNYCGSGVYMITLGMDGNLYPCHRFATNKNKFSIGNVDTGIDKDKINLLEKGQKKINKEIGGTKIPLCYAANYDIDGKFKYHNNAEIMTNMEYEIYDYWLQKMNQLEV